MTVDTSTWTEVTDEAALRELLGTPSGAALGKERTALHELDRQWIAASPFCSWRRPAPTAPATSRRRATRPASCTSSTTPRSRMPERPGNKRADGCVNVLSNPHVGLIFLVPGRADTLRVNGRARLVSEAPFFDDMVVKGHRPLLALVVEVEQVFHHCGKAFLRSRLWDPESWGGEDLPRRAVIARTLERPQADPRGARRVLRPGVRRAALPPGLSRRRRLGTAPCRLARCARRAKRRSITFT